MRTATSLTLVAIGAILTFAVTASPSFLNLQVTGVVIMAVGVAGMFLHRNSWLRRRIVLRRGASGPVVGHVDETNFPSYVMIDPAALESVQPIADEADAGSPTTVEVPDGGLPPERVNRDAHSSAADPLVVEEYLEE